MWKEFKTFAFKGNVLDLAIAVIIGAAFGKIISALVTDLLMPALGLLIGGTNLGGLEFKFGSAVLKYGDFLQTVVDFLIIAISIFLFVKLLSKLKRKEEVKPSAPESIVLSDEAKLLVEIRDLLKQRQV